MEITLVASIALGISIFSLLSAFITNIKGISELNKLKLDIMEGKLKGLSQYSELREKSDKIFIDIDSRLTKGKRTKEKVNKAIEDYCYTYLGIKQDLIETKITIQKSKKDIIHNVILDDIFSMIWKIADLQYIYHEWNNNQDFFSQDSIDELYFIVKRNTSTILNADIRRAYNEYINRVPVNNPDYGFKRMPVTPIDSIIEKTSNFIKYIQYGYFGKGESPYI